MSIKSFRKIDIDTRSITIKNETPLTLNIAITSENHPPTIKKVLSGTEVVVKIYSETGVDNSSKAATLKIFSENMIEIGEPYQLRSSVNYHLIKQGGPSADSNVIFVSGMYFSR
jgi:hypothetical protein